MIPFKRTLLVFLSMLAISLHSFAQEATPTVDVPRRSELTSGWTPITPGGETLCARGTPFSFFAREGSSEDLLIEFQGGGACWDAQTCSPTGPTFDPSVEINGQDNPANAAVGIHDLDNPENPFRDYDAVFIPYCTGDVQTGSSTITYQTSSTRTFEMNFNGAANARAALAYAYRIFDTPESVAVAGCSAGAISASFWASDVIARYPAVPAIVIGDSAGGYLGNIEDQFTAWNTAEAARTLPIPAYASADMEDLSFVGFWEATMLAFPQARYAQFNTAFDSVQTFFTSLSDRRAEAYDDALAANLQTLTDANPTGFRYVTVGGSEHCVLPRNELFTFAVNGTRFADWLTAFEANVPVESMTCEGTTCRRLETIPR